jgi:heptosyltransferase II
MQQPQNILIRLPNWLGDMVMSTAFLQALQHIYPTAQLDIICKKELDFLVKYLPNIHKSYSFSKQTHKGITGAWKFGREIRQLQQYDLVFCLPNSFSSAVMTKAIGAKYSIGYKKELRSIFLSHSYPIPKQLHRVEEYTHLLALYCKQTITIPKVHLKKEDNTKQTAIIININSEASSRRLPFTKAISILNSIRKNIDNPIILIGAPKEATFVTSVYNALENQSNIINKAGATTIDELIALMQTCTLMLTTDSGPAHVANALGVHTVVLFGAGNEQHTAPYNAAERTIIRLGKLPCEPCVNNICKQFKEPECLLQLEEERIVASLKRIIKKGKD